MLPRLRQLGNLPTCACGGGLEKGVSCPGPMVTEIGFGLEDLATNYIPEGDLELLIYEFVTATSSWNWMRFVHFLPEEVSLKIVSTLLPTLVM